MQEKEVNLKKVSSKKTLPKASGTGGGTSKWFIILFILVVAGFAWSSYSYFTAKQEIEFLATPEGQEEANQKLVADTLADVGKLIVLPDEDNPFVFTINDAEQLAEQEAFYSGAQNGDRLIVFSDRAIIYSPSRDILVNVGPVRFEGVNDQLPPPLPTPEPPTPEPQAEEETEG